MCACIFYSVINFGHFILKQGLYSSQIELHVFYTLLHRQLSISESYYMTYWNGLTVLDKLVAHTGVLTEGLWENLQHLFVIASPSTSPSPVLHNLPCLITCIYTKLHENQYKLIQNTSID